MIKCLTIYDRGLPCVIGSIVILMVMSGAVAQDRLGVDADITLRAHYSYDTNIFLTSEAEGDAFIRYSANANAAIAYNQLSGVFEGVVHDKHYDTFFEQNSTDFELRAHAVLGEDPLSLSMFAQRLHIFGPVDTTNVSQWVHENDQARATIKVLPAYLFGVELTGYYEDGTYIDYDDYEYLRTGASVRVYGMYDKHTKVGLKYYWGDQDYDEHERYDVEITRATAFVDHDNAGHLRAHAELGYETFEFQTLSSVNDTVDKVGGPYAKVSVHYTLNPKWTVEGELLRSIDLSYVEESTFNRKLKMNVGAIYRPMKQIRIESSVYYTHTDEESTFDNASFGGEFGVAYALSTWSEVAVDYEYHERESSAIGKDYDRQLVSIGLAVRW